MLRKKLIEVALPLDAINKASAREKSIRHGHPSTLHLWWARRPLAAARAVIFAQMVDDPSAWPELFPTEEAQEAERRRLFGLIEELVVWKNTTNEALLERAREEIRKSWRRTCADNKGHPRAAELFDPERLPAFHDPFAGGGSLPLEAQRLGLEAHASDLNPVAVLINKAMIEIPPKFAGRPPVNPESRARMAENRDTVHYLERELNARKLPRMAAATGDTASPTELAWRFSPRSNEQETVEDEIRVLIATDVLSEGQNLQDCAIVVNYDLPWAIIRLIQRAGRVDRIGQRAEQILCYSFLPAEGVDRLIRLRSRVRERLQENAEVVGTDEAFFEDEDQRAVQDLYNEKAGILDGEESSEVDLASYAYQIWQNATKNDAALRKTVEEMPAVVYSSKRHAETMDGPEGVLAYIRTASGHDALAWRDKRGNSVTESQFDILRAAACEPDTPAVPRHENHHELVTAAAEQIAREEPQEGGQLGRPSGARFKVYERLKRHAAEAGDLLTDRGLPKALDDIYRYPLLQSAVDILNRQMPSASDADLAALVCSLRDDGRLCNVREETPTEDPQIICSMGLVG